MYELSINAVNLGVLTPGNLSLAIGVTGVTFTNASAYATGNQPSLTVQWSVPSQCNVDYYRVSYQLISRKACQDVPVIDAPVYELIVTSFLTDVSKYLTNLEYYSTYNVSIVAVIMIEESLPMHVNGDTRDGDPSAIESVSYTSTAHSLRFVWEEPSCESLHGVFDRYEYDLYDPTGGGRYVRYPTTIRRKDVQITGLDACTEYHFRIRVVTTPLRGSEWHMEMAMTNISAPGIPDITELTTYQEDSGTTGLIVSWQPPTSPPCQPTHYEIKYYLLQGDMCEDITSRDGIMTSAGTVNGSTFTFNVLELRPNSEYMVFVRGRTILGSNWFGQDGSFSCDSSGDDHSPGCRGKLFCLPDPFGCTCAAGFMGINCTTECKPGTYGANCLQLCHCSPSNTCAKGTGECIDGTACQEGWTGVNCQATTSATNPVSTTVPPQTVPYYAIASFYYTKVNNGEPTTLVCVVTGSPPPTSENIIVTDAAGADEGIILLGTNVTESTRTSWYRVMVNLDEVPQNFMCLLRIPDRESVSKDLAVSVYGK
eukprot:XP_011662116.1 PREDICTED: uncharacterized protein LOC105437329 [Strongylocentrotus purpuratus]